MPRPPRRRLIGLLPQSLELQGGVPLPVERRILQRAEIERGQEPEEVAILELVVAHPSLGVTGPQAMPRFDRVQLLPDRLQGFPQAKSPQPGGTISPTHPDEQLEHRGRTLAAGG